MAKENDFAKGMDSAIEAMVKNASYDPSTRHVTLSLKDVELSKGVTEESMAVHANEFNRLTVIAGEAVANILRDKYDPEAEKPITSIDGTLSFNGGTINTAHHLIEGEVGTDTVMFGTSYTAIDFTLSKELNEYQNACTNRNIELASKLFN